jgi:hypothetical protein
MDDHRKPFNEAAAEFQAALVDLILTAFPWMTRLLRWTTRLAVRFGATEARRHG